MLVEETLAVVLQTPFRNDAAATAHHAREALLRKMHVLQANAAVYGEIVHALFALLNKRVTINFPREVLSLAAHLLHGLVHRHSANGHGAVAHNPLASFVDVIARGKVHNRVAAPLAAPHRLFHLFFNARGGGGVADIGIDLDEEVAADNHRLGFGVVDVGGNNGTPLCHLLAHKFGRDMRLDSEGGAVHVLADAHILHFGCDDALLGQCHLRHCLARQGTQGQVVVGEAQTVKAMVGHALAAVNGRKLREPLYPAALQNPFLAQARQTATQVDVLRLVGIRTARVVDKYGRVLLEMLLAVLVLRDGGRKCHFAHRHTQFREQFTLHIYFFAGGIGYPDVVVLHDIIVFNKILVDE